MKRHVAAVALLAMGAAMLPEAGPQATAPERSEEERRRQAERDAKDIENQMKHPKRRRR